MREKERNFHILFTSRVLGQGPGCCLRFGVRDNKRPEERHEALVYLLLRNTLQ